MITGTMITGTTAAPLAGMAVARPAVDSAADGSEPSRTSQAVALLRAELPRLHTPGGDPDAQRRLCAGMRAAPAADQGPSIAARTRFFDGQVLAAICAGVRQIVILGSGYDDRALRFRSPGVTFFELDHSGTQADKRARLHAILAEDESAGSPAAGEHAPVLAAADFTSDDVAVVLAGAGHDPGLSTLFLCEGLLVYLDQVGTVRFLASVRGAAAAGSLLAASLVTHADGLDSDAVVARGNARRRTAGAEPWRTILPAAGQSDLLARSGWRIVRAVDAADLGTGADPGRSLLVTAEPAG